MGTHFEWEIYNSLCCGQSWSTRDPQLLGQYYWQQSLEGCSSQNISDSQCNDILSLPQEQKITDSSYSTSQPTPYCYSGKRKIKGLKQNIYKKNPQSSDDQSEK